MSSNHFVSFSGIPDIKGQSLNLMSVSLQLTLQRYFMCHLNGINIYRSLDEEFVHYISKNYPNR